LSAYTTGVTIGELGAHVASRILFSYSKYCQNAPTKTRYFHAKKTKIFCRGGTNLFPVGEGTPLSILYPLSAPTTIRFWKLQICPLF